MGVACPLERCKNGRGKPIVSTPACRPPACGLAVPSKLLAVPCPNLLSLLRLACSRDRPLSRCCQWGTVCISRTGLRTVEADQGKPNLRGQLHETTRLGSKSTSAESG